MQQPYEYQFPERNPFRAKEVTEPEFLIQSRPDWFEALWVDFSAVRNNRQFDRLKFDLGLIDDRLANLPNEYSKVIFSGHRGSGKSVELRRFAGEIDRPEAFLTLFIDLEQETEIQRIESEDLFVILTTVLVRELQRRNIPIPTREFNDIALEWMEETVVARELKNEYGLEAEAGASLGFNFWKFLGVQGNLKGVFAQNNATTRTIRQKIRLNQKALIQKLNQALVGLRKTLRSNHQPRELLFIIDGLEKARPEVYETLFVRDVQFMHNLDAHLICCVPIHTFYEIQHQTAQDLFHSSYLPMIRVSEQSIPLLREVITRRVDPSLFEEGVIGEFIQASGGCPRQLLVIVNQAIVNALGEPITLEVARQTLQELGIEKWRGLTRRHIEILQSGRFESADKELLELLYSLNLFEYNGTNPERKINPLLQRFFDAE